MQKAIPLMAYIPASSGGPRPPAVEGQVVPEGMAATTAAAAAGGSGSSVGTAVAENAVIVIGRRGCCMCHVATRLLLGLGVNPAVYEVDDVDESVVVKELQSMIRTEGKDGRGGEGGDKDQKLQFPAVFVGGRLFGGLEKVMATHISGELVPILREAGALWL